MDITKNNWFTYLEKDHQSLVKTAVGLIEKEQEIQGLPDYSFIIFSMSKAYEGFLKRYFLDFGFISEKDYYSKRFRVGRALNPDVKPSHRDERWIYDDVERNCGRKVADELWNTWLSCRNRVFHFFPKGKAILNFSEAVQKVETIMKAMENAMVCAIDKGDYVG